MNKGVILHIELHAKARHRILEKYLKAWFPIISTNDKRILYLDGFAGSGEYDDGSFGSPIIPLEAAKNHSQLARFASEILFYFIELDEARYEHLVSVLDNRYRKGADNSFKELPRSFNIVPIHGEFNTQVSNILDRLEKTGSNLAPTIAFVDPFGYKDIDIEVLGGCGTKFYGVAGCFKILGSRVNRLRDSKEDDKARVPDGYIYTPPTTEKKPSF